MNLSIHPLKLSWEPHFSDLFETPSLPERTVDQLWLSRHLPNILSKMNKENLSFQELTVFVTKDKNWCLSRNQNFEKLVFATMSWIISQYLKNFLMILVVISVNVIFKILYSGMCQNMEDSLIAQLVKNLPAMQEIQVQFLGWEDPLEKEMATHSSILACGESHGKRSLVGYSPQGRKSRKQLRDITSI